MINKWKLKGFKSIYSYTEFDLYPLTIFTGANSSGKSSVIQSILLTAQTLQNNIPTKSIILNGQIVRLGTFNDIHSYNSDEKDITVGFDLNLINSSLDNKAYYLTNNFAEELDDATTKALNTNIVAYTYKFSIDDNGSETSALQPLITQTKISIYGETKKELIREIEAKRTETTLEEKLKKLNLENTVNKFVESLNYDVIVESVEESNFNESSFFNINSNIKRRYSEEFVGAELNHFIPQNTISRIDKQEVDANRLIQFLMFPEFEEYPKEFDSNLINESVINIFSTILNEVSNKKKGSLRNKKFSSEISNFISKLRDLNDLSEYSNILEMFSHESKFLLFEKVRNKHEQIREAMLKDVKPKYTLVKNPGLNLVNNEIGNQTIKYFNNNVKYLGPLRDEPKPIYPNTTSLDSKDVGYKGEYTAAVLELHKDTVVEYISPKMLNQDKYEVRKSKLINAVLEWLEYMGISSEVKTFDRGKLGHELQVRLGDEGKFNDLTNVGVGVSQVLPILVLALLSERHSTIIFEQPELHLHPKVQTRLADFFSAIISLNKQCIVETHSEYLINRLRYRAVSSPKDNIPEKVMMYFVEQESGKSIYRPIQINEYGVIEDWPKGFFDEHENLAMEILKASRDKIRRGD